ncbi:Hypothetical_protein [Hexamita inflata]|uniref:Hypothetical_protein n=1 Tax=Hexamita inflata TaxID=28002 RepID=A0AA86ULE2_9EUKA|nr:Hypothetical protein HINF_LOCUS50460 [Hexamita inflata]
MISQENNSYQYQQRSQWPNISLLLSLYIFIFILQVQEVVRSGFNQAVTRFLRFYVRGFLRHHTRQAISAELGYLAVFSQGFGFVLAEKLHIPEFEPETKRMQHINTTNQIKLISIQCRI